MNDLVTDVISLEGQAAVEVTSDLAALRNKVSLAKRKDG